MIKTVALVEFCPPRLGSDRRIYELLTRLPSSHRVSFIVLPPSRALLGLIPMPAQHERESRKSLVKNITASYISIPKLARLMWRSYMLGYFLTFLCTWPKVFRKVVEDDPRIIVLNYPSAYTGLLGFSVGKLLGKMVVADFNDIIAEYTVHVLNDSIHHSRKNSNGIFKAMIQGSLTAIQNYIIRHADLVTALTTYTVNYSRLNHIREDIHLIPDGVDVDLFSPQKYSKQSTNKLKMRYGIKKDEKLIFYTGRIEKWAGVEIVLQCARKLRDSGLKFLLVGEGSLKIDNNLPNIVQTGRIPHELIPQYLASADLVLVPMVQDMLGHSASPLKLFEAMAMGKPVIASDTKGMHEILRNNIDGILLPQEANIWAKTIVNVLGDPPRSSALGANARRKMETEFDWNFLANEFIRLLSEALKD